MNKRITSYDGHGYRFMAETAFAAKPAPVENPTDEILDILYDQIKHEGVTLLHIQNALAHRIMLQTTKSKAAEESLGLENGALRGRRGEVMAVFRKAGDHVARQAESYHAIDRLCAAILDGQTNWNAVRDRLTAFAMDDHETYDQAMTTLIEGGIAKQNPVRTPPPAPLQPSEIQDRTAEALGVIYGMMRAHGNRLGIRDMRYSIAANMIERTGHSHAARILDMGRSTMYRIQQDNAELLQSPTPVPQQCDKYKSAIDKICDALEAKAATLQDIERECMEIMLGHAKTRTDCASALGLGRSTLYRKLQTMDLG